MQAAVLECFGQPLAIKTMPTPQPCPGEVTVAIQATPVLSYTNEVLANIRPQGLQLPLVPGCGPVGQVLAVGPDATRLRPGDWVYCDPMIRARDMAEAPDAMLHGWAAPSAGAQSLHAHFHDGAFAEAMLLPLENAVPLGQIEADEAHRWCAIGSFLVPYGGLLAGGFQPGQVALISGATGHFGSAAVALALAMGAPRVIAPGRNAARLDDLRRRFGDKVQTVLLSGDESHDRQRMQEAGHGEIDLVLDILPPLDDAAPIRAAAMAVRPGGTVVLMGGTGVGLELPYRHLMRNNITLRGQWMYPREAVPRLIAMVNAGLLSLGDFTFSQFGLHDVNEAVAHAAKSAGPFRMTILGLRGQA